MGRKQLKKLKSKKVTAEAKFVKFGYKHDSRELFDKSTDNLTVLFKNIVVNAGSDKIYIDHCWLKMASYNGNFPVDLREGSIIKFKAEIQTYKKYKSRSYSTISYGFKNFKIIKVIKENRGGKLNMNIKSYCNKYSIPLQIEEEE